MSRPRPNICKKNLIREYKNLAYRIADQVKLCPDVEGICVSGGVSRGFADRYSDIEFLIYLNHEGYKKWREKEYVPPIPQMGSKYGGKVIDVQWLDLKEEKKRKWTEVEKWDRSYCLILYDKKRTIAKLLVSKLHCSKESRDLLIFNSLSEMKYNLKLSHDMIHRKCFEISQLIMNKILSDIIKITFFINNEYLPHEKWRLHLLNSLPWKPSCFKKSVIVNSLSTKMKLQQSQARHYLLKTSYKECLKKFLFLIDGQNN